MLVSQFGPLGLNMSYAAVTGTFIASQTTANATATTGTQSVTTFTVDVA